MVLPGKWCAHRLSDVELNTNFLRSFEGIGYQFSGEDVDLSFPDIRRKHHLKDAYGISIAALLTLHVAHGEWLLSFLT